MMQQQRIAADQAAAEQLQAQQYHTEEMQRRLERAHADQSGTSAES